VSRESYLLATGSVTYQTSQATSLIFFLTLGKTRTRHSGSLSSWLSWWHL